MKQKLLITSDIYKPLMNKARQSNLTPDELAEVLIKRELKLK
jgi:hypothetical protein|tara:strand:+ start:2972 stop:3097 length:126 start_codon:yes stop_codon:yes gene_type:complete